MLRIDRLSLGIFQKVGRALDGPAGRPYLGE
jgi:hypothetical protein